MTVAEPVQRAIVLLSGGLDSATVLAEAKECGYQIYALSFDYSQRHRSELDAARRLALSAQVTEHRVIDLTALGALGGSALTDTAISVPEQGGDAIPVTYVPARNTIFLSYALAWAEVLAVNNVFIGVNAVDYSGYPDCRPEFVHAFSTMANLATKAAVEGHQFHLHTPLINMTKAEIIRRGIGLGVDYSLTVSCYQADAQGRACGHCDSCRLRAEGFSAAGIPDPTRYC
ncbi:MAG: 7-cyano-7-deazaguanine synthase QueC [Gammaproteobacteria bacterium]|nr:7-cyano-7-deazaguanine synthase QueC [Gammaproteobacteria bacterium]PCH64797.1 MAG: 7-cyano-7-deazaguanine synthase QueC [Gammaproteobacteria bacterium]